MGATVQLTAMRHFLLCSLLLGGAWAEDKVKPTAKPAVRELSPGIYALGEIRIDAAKREVSFPAEVGTPNREIEYAIVNERGKAYESLMVTKITAMDLQVALLLAHYKPWPESLFVRGDEPPKPEATKEVPAAKARISLEWTDAKSGQGKSAPLHAWLLNGGSNKAPSAGDWIFTGLRERQPDDPPLDLNQIVAVFLDSFSPINFAGRGNDNDDIWQPASDQIPPEKTKITVRIAPREAKVEKP